MGSRGGPRSASTHLGEETVQGTLGIRENLGIWDLGKRYGGMHQKPRVGKGSVPSHENQTGYLPYSTQTFEDEAFFNNATCPFCRQTERETISHLIFVCQAWARRRRSGLRPSALAYALGWKNIIGKGDLVDQRPAGSIHPQTTQEYAETGQVPAGGFIRETETPAGPPGPFY